MNNQEYEEKLAKCVSELSSSLKKNYVSEQACWILADYIGKIEKKYKGREEKLIERARIKAKENIEKRGCNES